MHPLQWLGQRDRDFAALRRAGRTAIVMPAMFAVGDKVIGNTEVATFAAFGSFASATAVRMIWTGGHLDAVRRLQTAIVS